jgi:hypothetical protein
MYSGKVKKYKANKQLTIVTGKRFSNHLRGIGCYSLTKVENGSIRLESFKVSHITVLSVRKIAC